MSTSVNSVRLDPTTLTFLGKRFDYYSTGYYKHASQDIDQFESSRETIKIPKLQYFSEVFFHRECYE